MGSMYSVMNEYFTWKAHVKYLLGKTGKRIGMLRRVRKNISMYLAECTSHIYFQYSITVILFETVVEL